MPFIFQETNVHAYLTSMQGKYTGGYPRKWLSDRKAYFPACSHRPSEDRAAPKKTLHKISKIRKTEKTQIQVSSKL